MKWGEEKGGSGGGGGAEGGKTEYGKPFRGINGKPRKTRIVDSSEQC